MNTPVRPDHAPFSTCRLSSFHRTVNQFDQSCTIIRMNQVFEGCLRSAEAGGWQAVHRLKFGRPSIHTCTNVPFEDAATLRENLLGYFADFLPPAAYQIFAHTLDEVATNASGGKITVGLFLSLWFGAGGVTSMISTLNEAYHVHDNRSFLKVRAIAVGLTTVISVLTFSALVLVMIGSHVAEMLGELLNLRRAIVLAWQFLHWPLAAFFLVLAFSLIYYYAPDLKEQHWYWITPGSLVGVLLWLAASGLFRGYLHFFNNYSRTYGSLGAVIVLLLWLYVTALAFLIGGEINAIIEQAAAERGHPEAKAAGQKEAA